MRLKHAVEFKLPKFLDSRISKLSEEEKEKFGSLALIWGGGLLAVTVIYLTGYNKGLKKSVGGGSSVYIIKGGN